MTESPEGTEKTNDAPGLPNSYFGPISPSDPSPFSEIPKEMLDQLEQGHVLVGGRSLQIIDTGGRGQ